MSMELRKAAVRVKRHTFYRHYKGTTYRVLCVAVRESDQIPVVVYEDADGDIWERPFFEWEELVDHGGRYIQRFVRLPEHVAPSNWPPRDDFETFNTPETQLRKQLQDALAAMHAKEDLQFLSRLRECGVPSPRMTLKEAAVKLGIDLEEMKQLIQDACQESKEPNDKEQS